MNGVLGEFPYSLFYSPFPIHHSLFTIPYSPFTIHHSPFTFHVSRFTFHVSQKSIPRSDNNRRLVLIFLPKYFLDFTILYIVLGYALFGVIIYFIQDKFIFKPEKLSADFQFRYDAPFKELFFEIEPGVTINGLHFFRTDPKGLILYFHGNSRSIKGWGKYAKDFYRYDYDVVLVDYRGFGKSTGKRSEGEMLKDMQFVYERLAEQYTQNQIIVYGRSLGSGFAAKIASDNKPRYLILDAPYYSFLKVIERFLPMLPVRFVLRYHLRTDKWIRRVNCHTYIIHGTKDRLIPIRNSEKLQAINPHKITLIRIIGGGHNNLPGFPEYHNFLRDILKY